MGNKESGEIKFDQWKEYLYIYIFFVLTKRERFPFHSRILKEGEEETSSTNDGEKRLIAVTIQYILVINFICMENGSRVEFSFETDGNRHPCVISSPPPHKIIKHPAWRKAHVPHAFIRSLAKHPTPFCAINNTQTILLFPSKGSKKKFRHPITRHRPPSRLISKRRRTDTMRGKRKVLFGQILSILYSYSFLEFYLSSFWQRQIRRHENLASPLRRSETGNQLGEGKE